MRTSRRLIRPALLALGIGLLAGACARRPASGDSTIAASPVVTLAVRGAQNTGASVASAGYRVVVTWAATIADQTNIYAAVSDDDARTFGAPVRVNDIDNDARVSGEQAPRVSIGHDLVVAWTSRLSGTSHVRSARSTDGGRTFVAAKTLHAADVTGSRGWLSLTTSPDNAVHAVWLDGRDAKHESAGTRAGAPHVMRQDIFHAMWRPDGTFTNGRIASNVCFCCKTGVTTAADGTIYAAWRHIYPTNLRDIAVASSTDGGLTFSEPVRVSEDHWQINGCPEDGPSIATSADGVLHVAWPTVMQEPAKKAVFYTFSADGGKTFAPRTRLDDAGDLTAARPHLSAGSSGATVVWQESGTDAYRIRVREITAGGAGPRHWAPRTGPTLLHSGTSVATYPSVAVAPAGTIVAWASRSDAASEIHVQRIDRPRP